jgi:phenylacetate-coenzyme A ligase PaaK-like adenylate-forming protein
MENFDAVVTDQRLRRVDLHRHLADDVRDEMLFDTYRIVATAGTSGLRGVFVYDRAAWRVVLANTLRWQRFSGIVPRLHRRVRICSIGADSPMHVTSRIPMSGNVGLFRLLHLQATDRIDRLIRALTDFQPDAVFPYPSVAALLAREQLAGRLAITPRVIATHSELLTPEMARLIEQAWGIKPFNHYGLTEEPHVAADCAMHAGLHLFEDTAMIEVVDNDFNPVPDGTMGTRYLLTNLYNRVQPLIRYEVTDMLCKAAQPCACGRPFTLIAEVGGRAEDMLRLPRADGRPGDVQVTPMVVSLAIEAFLGVLEYAAEHDATGIRLRLVVPDSEDRRHIAEQLPARLNADIVRHNALPPPIALDFVENLERSAQRMGKISIVVGRPAAVLPAEPTR